MEEAIRIKGLESAIFTEMDVVRKNVAGSGVKIINLGIGSPDQPPAKHIQEALVAACQDIDNYGYPSSEGTPELRRAISLWYQKRFGIDIDPEDETLVLMGSQDGLSHIAQAFVNPGDLALIPDPHYPIYRTSIILAGGVIHTMPLESKNNFLPNLKHIPEHIAKASKLMILNYPNNPVAAIAPMEFYRQVVDFARRYDVLICHDAAYTELAFDGYKPLSFLEVPGAKEVGIEFHSVSKTYNMAGCRLGFVVGNRYVLSALARIKSNIDYGVFKAIQKAGIAALTGPQESIRNTVVKYQKRRDILVDGLSDIGWKIVKPQATMFVWAALPPGYKDSKQFAIELLEKTGVLVIPGVAFGKNGEGYVRIALVQGEDILKEAINRIKQSGILK